MKIPLSISNSSSVIHTNNSYGSNSNKIEINRIDDDAKTCTLWEIVYNDKYLIAFLKITGFHWIPDKRDHVVLIIISKLWLLILLTFGSIGLSKLL